MKLNNKGQTLVLFVCFLPLIILVLSIVIDIGYMITSKKKLDNINLIAIQYIKNHPAYSEKDVYELIKKNDSKLLSIKIDHINNTITLEKNIESIMGKIVGINKYHLLSSYNYQDKIKRLK